MVVKRLQPPFYADGTSEERILRPEPVEYAEPVIDCLRWKTERILSMLIQKNGQPPHDAKAPPRAEPVHIVDWDLVGSW
jgi:hypothetical protein